MYLSSYQESVSCLSRIDERIASVCYCCCYCFFDGCVMLAGVCDRSWELGQQRRPCGPGTSPSTRTTRHKFSSCAPSFYTVIVIVLSQLSCFIIILVDFQTCLRFCFVRFDYVPSN
jgi:hypothetical protein